ncbi:hypothetical protein [Halapricum hydrolyticum]|uniref:Uncharacterized protein n=1 Tax=Halapricum hydrolyticum TaxID=2979991 RepID=A0AAE3LE71_9EURY|nr:hypothetical protein [Halapricum hydrolyticum]MCU4716800.1 hypothetical protein [Halapricum hydrolyticum]MCU4725595.1 hypothetical protein [Halapricum hydrolyticum]
MEKHAVVRGEIHVSNTDRKALFNRDLTDYKAVCMEGRSDFIRLHKDTSCYYLYLIGHFTLNILYRSFSVIHSTLSSDAYDVEQEANKHGLDFVDEIDLEIHEIYESYSSHLRKWLAVFIIGLFSFSLVGAFLNDTIIVYRIDTGIPYWLMTLTMGMLVPFIYSGLLLLLGDGRDRNEKMATEIDSLAEDKDYDEILVLVGDKHVDPVGDELENYGWEIKRERSDHCLARIRQQFPE